MDAVQRDSVIHKLGTIADFYGKQVDQNIARFWLSSLSGRSADEIITAFDQHVQQGKYMPKPVEILEIIHTNRIQAKAQTPQEPPKPHTPCPKEIHNAWVWFIAMYTEGSKNCDGMFRKRDVDAGTEERYLHIVNHEAHKAGLPGAIPDEFKLREVWG